MDAECGSLAHQPFIGHLSGTDGAAALLPLLLPGLPLHPHPPLNGLCTSCGVSEDHGIIESQTDLDGKGPLNAT